MRATEPGQEIVRTKGPCASKMAANGHRSNNAALHQLSHALWIRTVCFREVQALHRPMQHADNVLLDTSSNAVQVHAHQ